jgi:hypothetical protein
LNTLIAVANTTSIFELKPCRKRELPVDFNEMARRAKAEQHQRDVESSQVRDAAARERERAFESIVSELNTLVLPLFEQAKASFASEGIPVIISNNWDQHRPTWPALEFKCVGERIRNSHGGYGIPQSLLLSASHRDGAISVMIAKEVMDRHPNQRVDGDTLEQSLAAGIQRVLVSYLAEVSRIKSGW